MWHVDFSMAAAIQLRVGYEHDESVPEWTMRLGPEYRLREFLEPEHLNLTNRMPFPV